MTQLDAVPSLLVYGFWGVLHSVTLASPSAVGHQVPLTY